MQIIMDSCPASIFYKDEANQFIQVNRAFTELTGMTKEALIGKSPLALQLKDPTHSLHDDQEIIRTGIPKAGIIQTIQGANGTKWLQTDKVPYRNKQGAIIGTIGFAIDITARIQAEQALKQLNDGLEMRVAERTEALKASMENLRREVEIRRQTEQQLQATLANLERSNQELEQFAYVASHDLQEPLRMVSSYTQLLAQRYEDQLDEKAKKFIDYAVDGAVRMQRLINDLLAYSRVNTRGIPFAEIDTKAVLTQTLRNLAAAVEEAEAHITWEGLPTVHGDTSQLCQLFQNLLANALKFRGPEPPKIRISALDLGSEWQFSIKDNGIGIAPQYAEKVFVIFQRLHTRAEYPGTGIGLAICKRIAERHGGRIWFTSEPGKGTIFSFTLSKKLEPNR